jgi:hypothetical protein
MTAEAWAPRAVSGTGRDRRLERREREMKELWGEAWGLAKQGSEGDALEVFLEANDLGMAFDVDESRTCTLTGTVALGRARRPFTDWDADVAISHGRDEARPTALDRFVGWTDGNDVEHGPERLIGRPMVKAGVVTGLARKGLEPLFAILLSRPEDSVEMRVSRAGVIELHPGAALSGPTLAED